jgi:hypothetical protein
VHDIFDILKNIKFEFIFNFTINMIEIMMFIYFGLVHCEISLNYIC